MTHSFDWTGRLPVSKALLSITLLIAAAIPVSVEADSRCRRTTFEDPPRFVTAFLQAEDGASVLITDPAAATVIRYSMAGVRIEEVDGSTEFDPSGMARIDGGYLVQSGQARFAVLQEIREAGAVRFATHSSAALLRSDRAVELESLRLGRELTRPRGLEGDVARIYDWTPQGDASLVAHADILLSGGHWKSGIARVSLRDPRSFELLRDLPLDSAMRKLAVYQRNSMASVGGEVYILLHEIEGPAIYVHGRGAGSGLRKLLALPSPYDRVPELPTGGGEQGMVETFAALADATMGVELTAGADGRLYLLARQYDRASGERSWWVHEVVLGEKGTPRLAEGVRLPSSAEHLTLAPGSEWWLALERGSVQGHMKQAIASMLRVPSPWIEAPQASPLATAANPAALCN